MRVDLGEATLILTDDGEYGAAILRYTPVHRYRNPGQLSSRELGEVRVPRGRHRPVLDGARISRVRSARDR